jgi:hypothetical protein
MLMCLSWGSASNASNAKSEGGSIISGAVVILFRPTSYVTKPLRTLLELFLMFLGGGGKGRVKECNG